MEFPRTFTDLWRGLGVAILPLAALLQAGCAVPDDDPSEAVASAAEALTSPPTDLSPIGSASISQVFTWTGGADANQYRFYIEDRYNSFFTPDSLGCAGGGVCTTSALALPGGAALTWWVQALGIDGTRSAWVSADISTTAATVPTDLAPVGTASTSQVFSWTASANVTQYRFYLPNLYNRYDTPAELGCEVGGTCSTAALTLPGATLLTWYVQAQGNGGNSAWASASVTTGGTAPPAAPTDLSPAGAATISQVFTWTGDANASQYRFYIDGLYSKFYTTDELGCASGGACTTPALTLPGGASLTWSIQAWAGDGTRSAWVSAGITTTAATVPTDLAPVGTASISQVFSWTASANVTQYRFYLPNLYNRYYTPVELGCEVGGTCSTAALTLPGARSLTWYVSALGDGGNSAWASADVATGGSAAPVTPTGLSPAGAASISQAFTWNGDANASQYRFYIDGLYNASYTPASLGCAGGGACTTPALTLPGGSSLTWYVQAQGTGGNSGWASTDITTTPPAAPADLSPSGAAAPSQAYSWTGDALATQYRFYVEGRYNSTFTAVELDCVSGGTCTTPALTLPGGTSFTWYVQAQGPGGNSAWSSVDITTTGSPPPGLPTDLSPDGAASTNQAFHWASTTDTTQYRFVVSGLYDILYTPTELGCDSGGTCTTPSLSLPGGASSWWVQAQGPGGNSARVFADALNSSAPQVVSTTPADSGSAVASTSVAVTFDQPMDVSTLTAQTSVGSCTGSIQVSVNDFTTCVGFASAAPAMSSSNKVATLTPAPGLLINRTYKVRVTTSAMNSVDTALAGTYTSGSGFGTTSPSGVAQNESGSASEIKYCTTQWPLSLTDESAGSSLTVYGQMWDDRYGHDDARVTAQLGFGSATVNPEYESGWTWVDATYHALTGSNDEYVTTFTAPSAGSYRYAYRFSLDGGTTWTYCDNNQDDGGAGANSGLTFDLEKLAVLITH